MKDVSLAVISKNCVVVLFLGRREDTKSEGDTTIKQLKTGGLRLHIFYSVSTNTYGSNVLACMVRSSVLLCFFWCCGPRTSRRARSHRVKFKVKLESILLSTNKANDVGSRPYYLLEGHRLRSLSLVHLSSVRYVLYRYDLSLNTGVCARLSSLLHSNK
jgi:hypothetical protein